MSSGTRQLVEHAAGLHHGHPLLHVALAVAHAGLEGLLRDGLVREDPDHSLPARFTWRVIAIRAASICRAVTLPGSTTWSAKSPKRTSHPRCAVPLRLPFCCLRCPTFLGRASSSSTLPISDPGGGASSAEHLALEQPHLHADRPVGHLRLARAELDVRAGVCSGTRPRGSSPRAPSPSRRGGPRSDADALAPSFIACVTAFFIARRKDAALELRRDGVDHQLRVGLGLADLLHVDDDVVGGALVNFMSPGRPACRTSGRAGALGGLALLELLDALPALPITMPGRAV